MIVLRVNQEFLKHDSSACLHGLIGLICSGKLVLGISQNEAGGQRLISPTLLPGLLRTGSVTHVNSHFFPRVILGGPWSVTSLVMDFEEAGQLGL